MHQRHIIRRLSLAVSCLLFAGLAAGWAQQADDPTAKDPVQVGYAIVTPTAGPTGALVVFETFGEKHGSEMTQAGVLPSDMATRFVLFVNASGRLSRNLGVALANPDTTQAANVTLTLQDDAGKVLVTKTVVVPKGNQVAQFVTELFPDQPSVPKDLTGTLEITSNIPIAVTGLRFRGQNFSTLPATALSALSAVPVNGSVGGAGAVILAQFATGGGWSTEIVLTNTGATELTVRVDLFNTTGGPLAATLNGASQSSFTNIKIPAHGVVTLAPRDSKGDSDF